LADRFIWKPAEKGKSATVNLFAKNFLFKFANWRPAALLDDIIVGINVERTFAEFNRF